MLHQGCIKVASKIGTNSCEMNICKNNSMIFVKSLDYHIYMNYCNCMISIINVYFGSCRTLSNALEI